MKIHPAGRSCGCVEDTLRAKWLFADDGSEIRSMHLSHFAYRTPADGVRLVRLALDEAASRDVDGLFVAVPDADATTFGAAFGAQGCTVAPATVFGTGCAPGFRWNINVSEI